MTPESGQSQAGLDQRGLPAAEAVSPGVLVVIATGLATLGVALWYGEPHGLNVLLLAIASLATVLLLGRAAGAPATRSAWVLSIGILFFAGACVVYASVPLARLNLVTISGLLLLLIWERRLVPPLTLTPPGWVLVVVLSVANALIRPFAILPQLARGSGSGHVVVTVLLGAAIAVPLLLVFVPLLASADALYRQWLADVFSWITWDRVVPRVAIVIAGSWAALGLAGLLVRLPAGNWDTVDISGMTAPIAPDDTRLGPGRFLPAGIAATALGIVAIPFIGFVVVQLRYLFLPEQDLGFALGQISYADYARAGFAEMLVVALLVTVLLYVTGLVVVRDGPVASRLLDAVCLVIIACTLVIAISAFRRIVLYEEVFALTWPRLLVQLTIMAVTALLVCLAVSLLTRRSQLVPAAVLVISVALIGAVNLSNPEARIANSVLDSVFATGRTLDYQDFSGLSLDGIPPVVERLPQLDTEQRAQMQRAIDIIRAREEPNLAADWRSLNLSRVRAAPLLEQAAP